MYSHPHIRWIRPVRQARSQETLERLVDSAEALIADRGFDDVTVAEIATRAGFSVGAVYSRFHDKQGVLHSLQDRFVDEANLTTDDAFDPDRWQGASIEEIVSELVVFLVEIHRERRGVLRELLSRTKHEPSMIERKERLVAHVGEHLESLLMARASRIWHPNPAAAIRFGLRLVLSTLEQAILFDGAGVYGVPNSGERLASELTFADINFSGYGWDEIPEKIRHNYSMAPRGAQLPPGLPHLGYDINRKSEVWSENAPALYEESKSRHWIPSRRSNIRRSSNAPWPSSIPT